MHTLRKILCWRLQRSQLYLRQPQSQRYATTAVADIVARVTASDDGVRSTVCIDGAVGGVADETFIVSER